MDTVFGPFHVITKFCLDASELVTNPNDPQLPVFDLVKTHTYLDADASTLTLVCEDNTIFLNSCLFQSRKLTRCWTTSATGMFEGLAGHTDLESLSPSSYFCEEVAEEFPAGLSWGTMHLGEDEDD